MVTVGTYQGPQIALTRDLLQNRPIREHLDSSINDTEEALFQHANVVL